MEPREPVKSRHRTIGPTTFAEKDLSYYLRMIRGDFSELEEVQTAKVSGPIAPKNIVLLLTSDSIGRDGTDLGRRLMRFFLNSLANNRIKPKAVILTNSAVTLACENSEVLGKLAILEEQGVKILICALSCDELKCEERVKIGSLADMDAICDNLMNAWKVITL
jgi:intracellular sulfur oxidation DsrE/DsrF family protein